VAVQLFSKKLIYHERSNPRHNPYKTFNKFNNASGNKRHSIPYELVMILKGEMHRKKNATGPQYVDVDILKSIINNGNSNGSEFDDNYCGGNSSDDGDGDAFAYFEVEQTTQKPNALHSAQILTSSTAPISTISSTLTTTPAIIRTTEEVSNKKGGELWCSRIQ